jgi:hypothetical protein
MTENSKKSTARPADASTKRGCDYDKLRLNPDEQVVKWRFHRATDQRWRWQKITADHVVIAESLTSFAAYSDCVADASSRGYKPPPSPAGLSEPT